MYAIEQNYENEKMGAKAQQKPGINDRYPEQIHILFTILSSGVIKDPHQRKFLWYMYMYVNFQ